MNLKHISFKFPVDEYGDRYWIAERIGVRMRMVIARGVTKPRLSQSVYSLLHLYPMFEQLDLMYEEKIQAVSTGVGGKSKAKSAEVRKVP